MALDLSTMHLTFDDEFDSLSLYNGVSGTWDPTYGFGGDNFAMRIHLDEKQIYVDPSFTGNTSGALGVNPFSIHDGTLDITAAPTPPALLDALGGYQYTSGLITTRESFQQTYGYFEMKAELPQGQGLWPAFWLWPADGSYAPELDVMEMLGNDPSTIYTTVHSNGPSGHQFASNVADTSAGFHTYGADWEPDQVTWYFDGEQIAQTPTPADMHSPMFLLANLAVGGTWPGSPDATTGFPANMQIDYIRAYTSGPGQSGVEGADTTHSVAGAAADFNGDGKSDILWQNDSGLPAIWTMDGTRITNEVSLQNVDPSWHVAAAADFNGDGKSDILWQNDSGLPAIWTMEGTRITNEVSLQNVDPSWHVAAAADFNGDGKSDILWQNDSGLPAIWTMDGTRITNEVSLQNVDPSWHVAAAADFNGDGKSDILWQNDSGLPAIWTMDGTRITNEVSLQNVDPSWHVAAAADFNGDGKSDILWQNDSGLPAIWTMDGTRITNEVSLQNVDPSWHVAAAADFNGDGKSDILWQNDSGLPAIWTMDGTNITSEVSLPNPGSDWHLI